MWEWIMRLFGAGPIPRDETGRTTSPVGGPGATVVSDYDLTPYGQPFQVYDAPGASAWPYNPDLPSYHHPGPVGRAVNRGLWNNYQDSAEHAWQRHPGLPGMGANAVYYDIFNPQLSLKPRQPEPSPAPQQ